MPHRMGCDQSLHQVVGGASGPRPRWRREAAIEDQWCHDTRQGGGSWDSDALHVDAAGGSMRPTGQVDRPRGAAVHASLLQQG
jgi:hypothetical protein